MQIYKDYLSCSFQEQNFFIIFVGRLAYVCLPVPSALANRLPKWTMLLGNISTGPVVSFSKFLLGVIYT